LYQKSARNIRQISISDSASVSKAKVLNILELLVVLMVVVAGILGKILISDE